MGLVIECQGSWIEKETRQEKRQKKEERKLGARTRELYFFLHRTQERGMKYKTNKSKK